VKVSPGLHTRNDVVFMKNIIELAFMCEIKEKDFVTLRMILQEPSFIYGTQDPFY